MQTNGVVYSQQICYRFSWKSYTAWEKQACRGTF